MLQAIPLSTSLEDTLSLTLLPDLSVCQGGLDIKFMGCCLAFLYGE
jgi:hypothetical protein